MGLAIRGKTVLSEGIQKLRQRVSHHESEFITVYVEDLKALFELADAVRKSVSEAASPSTFTFREVIGGSSLNAPPAKE